MDAYTFNDEYTWTVKNTARKLISPIAQAKFYKDLFYDTYSRALAEETLRDKRVYSLVQSAVFFYCATREQIARILQDGHVILLTREDLKINGLNKLRYKNYFFGEDEASFFTEEIYSELCRVLKPSAHSQSKIFFPAELSEKQRELAQSSRDYRRQIKGPAGSGKTTVLAFRAVDAFRKTNAPVLILTFNIALRNYIHDCISQALNSISGLEGRKQRTIEKFFTISHFHQFAGGYRAKNNLLTIRDEDGNDTYELTATPKKFKTIFVDETQDFQRSWMETIVRLLEPGGEIIFFGDRDQDLYHVRNFDRVPGVIGRPLELKGSYRLRTKILDLARAFQVKFFGGSVGNEIELPVEQSLFEDYFDEVTTVRYEFFPVLDVNAIVNIFKDVIREYQVPNDDIGILSQVIRNVRPVDKFLRDKGYKTTTTFETEEDFQTFGNGAAIERVRRAAKFGFWMESGKIKISTIQSYKGWGIHTEILIIGNDFTSVTEKEKFLNAEMLYTGITRAKKNLVVINIGDREYDEFFRATVEKLSRDV